MSTNNNNLRSSRKLAHLRHALDLPAGPVASGFEDVHLIHRCLPELNWKEVATATSFLGFPLTAPLIINAMTGGAQDVAWINGALGRVAKKTGIALALGSQTAGLENPHLRDSYAIARQENECGMILANVGAHISPAGAQEAVDMVGADALQVHLNPAQELVMAEGERNFRGVLDNIGKICQHVKVPVIGKEVGCGIASADAQALWDAGVQGIDVGGVGGTNFIAIELARRDDQLGQGLLNWGVPTVRSLVEVATNRPATAMAIIASGGIKTGLEVAKSLALGGTAVGIATPLLKTLVTHGEEALIQQIDNLITELKMIMLLLGVSSTEDLKQVPIIITGSTHQWLTARGIALEPLASR